MDNLLHRLFYFLAGAVAIGIFMTAGVHYPLHSSPVPESPCQTEWDISYEWYNPLICIDGVWGDTCTLASYAASETQDAVDQLEAFLNSTKKDTREGDALADAVEKWYAHQEMISSVCEHRPVKEDRLPKEYLGPPKTKVWLKSSV